METCRHTNIHCLGLQTSNDREIVVTLMNGMREDLEEKVEWQDNTRQAAGVNKKLYNCYYITSHASR